MKVILDATWKDKRMVGQFCQWKNDRRITEGEFYFRSKTSLLSLAEELKPLIEGKETIMRSLVV